MDYRKLKSNFSIAVVAQLVSMVLSLVSALLVPKILGVTEYGFWQLFVFYSSYYFLFSFGLHDGIYLVKGGQSREEVDKSEVHSQFRVLVAIQGIVLALFAIIGYTMVSAEERSFVLIATGIYIFVANVANYWGYVFQLMNETKLFSISNIVDRACYLAPLLVFVVFRVDSFEPYVVSYIATKTISAIWCLSKARDFLKKKPLAFKTTLREATETARVGIKLTISDVASFLIIGVMRFIVDATWGVDSFGQVSLAITITNSFLLFVTQACIVLFPALRQSSRDELVSFFDKARVALGMVPPLVYLLYFPLAAILQIWLPDYEFALQLLAFSLPICIFDSKMRICGGTYLKVLRKEKELMLLNVAALVLSAVLGLLAASLMNIYLVFGSAVLAIAARSIIAEKLVCWHLNRRLGFTPLEELLVSLAFILSFAFFNTTVAVVVVIAAYAAFLAIERKSVLLLIPTDRKNRTKERTSKGNRCDFE